MDYDVIVVGAGFTGLTAATQLMKAGVNVVLLEAQERVGGRVEAQVFEDGTAVDAGGQFFCRDMPEVVSLAREFGRTFVKTYAEGDTTYLPEVPRGRAEAIWNGVDALRETMIASDLSDPALRTLTAYDWAQRQPVEDDIRQGFLRMVTGLWCRAPEEIAFTYLAANDRRITNTTSELELFLAGTMHALADDLAATLGDRLRLGMPVTELAISGDGVTLMTGTGKMTAAQVVLAVPPIMARRLSYAPALPPHLTRALDAWSPGMVIKLNIRFERPFWRDRDLSGMTMWNDPQGLFACDASRDGYAGLIVFVSGPLAATWHDKPARELETFVIEKLAEALGDEARHSLDIRMRDWVDDRWSDGAYSDVITSLDATDAEATLTTGMPPLHFASSELSQSFPGYVEGAIVAGKQVAAKVLKLSPGR